MKFTTVRSTFVKSQRWLGNCLFQKRNLSACHIFLKSQKLKTKLKISCYPQIKRQKFLQITHKFSSNHGYVAANMIPVICTCFGQKCFQNLCTENCEKYENSKNQFVSNRTWPLKVMILQTSSFTRGAIKRYSKARGCVSVSGCNTKEQIKYTMTYINLLNG